VHSTLGYVSIGLIYPGILDFRPIAKTVRTHFGISVAYNDVLGAWGSNGPGFFSKYQWQYDPMVPCSRSTGSTV